MIDEAADFVAKRIGMVPETAIVLGSGLGTLADRIESAMRIPYREIPGLAPSSVAGHAGTLIAGRLGGMPVVALAGRYHRYEGWSVEHVVRPVGIVARLGARNLVLTNAAGSLRDRLAPGDLMLIEDHLDLMGGLSPIGLSAGSGATSMRPIYDPALSRTAMEVALECGIRLQTGIYAALLGPTYETRAEVRMVRGLGADAVGMSTVPEVIAAAAAGLRVLAISCITNAAAGLGSETLSHEDVLTVGRSAGERLGRLIEKVLARNASESPAGGRI